MTDGHLSRTTRRGLLAGSGAVAGAAAIRAPAATAHGDRGGGGLATDDWPGGPGAKIRPQDPDAELRSILRDIDPDRIRATILKLVSFGTRHTLSSQTDPNRGIGAARTWIKSELESYAAASGGRMTVEDQSFVVPAGSPRIPVDTEVHNVIATLHGDVDDGRTYVVSGHYDSRVVNVLDFTSDAPGADDDASGVAVSMELARVMAAHRPRATIKFVAVAGEEQNLYGSTFLANQLKADGVDVQGMLNNDIVGSSTADDGTRDRRSVRMFAQGPPPSEDAARHALRLTLGGENDSPARDLGRFVTEVAGPMATGMNIRMIYRLDRYLRGGDHTGFLNNGFPAVRFTEPAENFDHQHQDVRIEDGVQIGDLPQFCDFDYIAGVARVNGASLWSLAQAPGLPLNVLIDASVLTNDTVLRWQPGTDPHLAGYEVVWRPTINPFWTHVIDVGNPAVVNGAKTVTIDLSKDNVVLGVRSVSTDGYRSPAVFPFRG